MLFFFNRWRCSRHCPLPSPPGTRACRSSGGTPERSHLHHRPPILPSGRPPVLPCPVPVCSLNCIFLLFFGPPPLPPLESFRFHLILCSYFSYFVIRLLSKFFLSWSLDVLSSSFHFESYVFCVLFYSSWYIVVCDCFCPLVGLSCRCPHLCMFLRVVCSVLVSRYIFVYGCSLFSP